MPLCGKWALAQGACWGIRGEWRVVQLRPFGPAAALVSGLHARVHPDRVEQTPTLARQLARESQILAHHEAASGCFIVACVNRGASGRAFNSAPGWIIGLQHEQACSGLAGLMASRGSTRQARGG